MDTAQVCSIVDCTRAISQFESNIEDFKIHFQSQKQNKEKVKERPGLSWARVKEKHLI